MNREEIEEILNDPEMKRFVDAQLGKSAAIEYSYSPKDGAYVKAKGTGPMLFDGVCTVLKSIAAYESEDIEDQKLYVEVVCQQVLEELDEKSREKMDPAAATAKVQSNEN
ncbi:MAG: hypothetical protein Q4C66_05280 [Lachnospiraceae bacterium]|nr:hypothetical protein [Lachnospiraceae bacterium]